MKMPVNWPLLSLRAPFKFATTSNTNFLSFSSTTFLPQRARHTYLPDVSLEWIRIGLGIVCFSHLTPSEPLHQRPTSMHFYLSLPLWTTVPTERGLHFVACPRTEVLLTFRAQRISAIGIIMCGTNIAFVRMIKVVKLFKSTTMRLKQ